MTDTEIEIQEELSPKMKCYGYLLFIPLIIIIIVFILIGVYVYFEWF